MKKKFILNAINWGLGIGDWGLGIGDWAQSPIPNPYLLKKIILMKKDLINYIYLKTLKKFSKMISLKL